MSRNLSGHILPTSATMVGVCMTVISIIKLLESGTKIGVITDQLLAINTVLFLLSALFSYLSIRSAARSEQFEKAADLLFLMGLFIVAISSIILAFELA